MEKIPFLSETENTLLKWYVSWGCFFVLLFFCHPTSLAQQATFCSPGNAAKAKGVKTKLETNKTRQKKLPGTATSNPITGTKQRQLIEVEKIGGHAELSC